MNNVWHWSFLLFWWNSSENRCYVTKYSWKSSSRENYIYISIYYEWLSCLKQAKMAIIDQLFPIHLWSARTNENIVFIHEICPRQLKYLRFYPGCFQAHPAHFGQGFRNENIGCAVGAAISYPGIKVCLRVGCHDVTSLPEFLLVSAITWWKSIFNTLNIGKTFGGRTFIKVAK